MELHGVSYDEKLSLLREPIPDLRPLSARFLSERAFRKARRRPVEPDPQYTTNHTARHSLRTALSGRQRLTPPLALTVVQADPDVAAAMGFAGFGGGKK